MANKIVTRFPPSPTGYLHLGSVRTALFNYLFARKNGGSFLLRIEDTDRERSNKKYEEDIITSLKWLGLNWDNEKIPRQSERAEVYKRYLEQLIACGKAYISKEEVVKEGDRAEVIRLKNSGEDVVFNDLIRGEVKFNTAELGDFVIAKSIDEAVYHFAVVIDDFEFGITHVIRGEDHISNTPRQILIGEALGFPRPVYAHIPLILAPDRSKLSKRHGATSLSELIGAGYLPEGVINYLALLGWHPDDGREIFTLEDLVNEFDISRVQKSGAIWNTEKLDWVNKEHLLKTGISNFQLPIAKKIKEILKLEETEKNKAVLDKVAPLIFERINKFGDIKMLADRGELGYFFQQPEYQKDLLFWKDDLDASRTVKRLQTVISLVEPIPKENFSADSVKSAIWNFASEEGRGSVLWPMRSALSGKERSPDPFALAGVLGKDETLARLGFAIRLLSR